MSPKEKAVSAASSIALNLMIKFDDFHIKPIEDNKEAEYEEKLIELEAKFTLTEEGIREYCENATKAYPLIENSDALFRVIMSECRLLHCNYKVIEHFAGDGDFLKNRMRITQNYPSGQLNESISDLQKILSSYVAN